MTEIPSDHREGLFMSDLSVAADVAIEADFRWPGSNARSIYVRDPAGNSIEFAEPRLWGKDDPIEDEA